MNKLSKMIFIRVIFLFSLFFMLAISSELIYAQELWTATSTTNVLPRQSHATVWTGTKMIVWGGNGANLISRIGNIYDPVSNSWSAIDSANSPSTRNIPAYVWTGTKMIIWGGQDYGGNSLNTGGIYDTQTNSWTPVSLTGAPAERCFHTAVWTGSKMIVWGGWWGLAYNNGGIYDPLTNIWTAISTVNAPAERYYHIAVWTGTKMIIWGGGTGSLFYNTGGLYDPITNTWTVISTTNAPLARWNPSVVWTGTKMIIWGGQIDVNNGTTKSGGIYDPQTNTWEAIDSVNAPSARSKAGAVWTGSKMVVWGGISMGYLNTGGIYNLLTDSWTPTSLINAPSGRELHSMVWTGTNMIVWGGISGSFATNTGGVYQNSSIGILKIENTIPSKFSLSQNYPNPFNSVTHIKFKISNSVGQSSRTVTLKIFDLLGREIATLVNEKLQPGTYEVRFDAGDLPSGIYFYQLKANNFIETKKLILLK